MIGHEVETPILNSPYEEPAQHWRVIAGEPAVKVPGRRPPIYFYRPAGHETEDLESEDIGTQVELKLVSLIRTRLKAWREADYPGVSRVTHDLLAYWRHEARDGRRLFFAQLEAAETVIFLTEGRGDFLQGVEIPLDEPSDERKAEGVRAFRRLCCKMATGGGKTTVMAMLVAWSILNKTAARADARFSDVVLVVCPNVTIRNRLGELDPNLGESSLYRTRDLVPERLMPALTQGRVIVINWHLLEPQSAQVGGVSARVLKTGKPVRLRETIRIGEKSTTARGTRYLSLADFERQRAAGLIKVREERRDRAGNLVAADVESVRYIESDTALVNRILGREVGGKQNILVINDEAHHAYRIRQQTEVLEQVDEDDESEIEAYEREATVWIEGLDRIHRLRGINLCVDFSATPYYLSRVSAQANRPFPWVVSDFGLVDAIESGLTKVPQLAVRDTSGAPIPGYFNIWRWILPRLSGTERGGRKGIAKPEAILKHAFTPIVMLAALWRDLYADWRARGEPRPPVFIIVCKNTRLAKVVYEWLAEDRSPVGIPSAGISELMNRPGEITTIRVDSRVIEETDSGTAKSDEERWMRLTLDTVGKIEWPRDRLGKPIYPEDFVELAEKMNRPLHPPGRDVRGIVSVGMLTEGWDCNTVTHIIGLRPFMSQLLCEQVVGRGLRRRSYELDDTTGRMSEEVAKVFGVPFEIIPFKESEKGPPREKPKTWRIFAVPEKARFEIRFPRVEGYRQAVSNRLELDWTAVAGVELNPAKVPPEVEMKAGLPDNQGRPSLLGPGSKERVDLNPYRKGRRLQQLEFEIARAILRHYRDQSDRPLPDHVLFPQLRAIVSRYLRQKVQPQPPFQLVDVYHSPYYGMVIERLLQAIHPVSKEGEPPELPRLEPNRGLGTTAEVDFVTRREPYLVEKSHLNFIVPDTRRWEQSAAYRLDRHPAVEAFVKNAGLGFAIPYVHDGRQREYQPDFIVRISNGTRVQLILETKGFDELKELKMQAAERWVRAVNADGRFGVWRYALATRPEEVDVIIEKTARGV
jgi:type III restriction enzyme